MTTVAEEIVVVCSVCGRTQRAKPDKSGGVKLPRGWKRDAERKAVCPECWRSKLILRALTFGVASPVSGTWKELEAELRPMWDAATRASNWMLTQCYLRDVRREADEKMPPMPPIYLYPEARILFPQLPPRAVAALEQVVQRKYRTKRFDVLWRSAASLPTMRFPQPYAIPNQGWNFRFDDNRPVVNVRIGEKQWELRLKSGARYRRQIDGLRRMADRGEMAIYKAHDGTMLVKLVGWLTRPPATEKLKGTLIVRTGKDHLLAALDLKGEKIWTENCDHLARWIAEHRKKLRRLSEDQKAEQRPVPSFAARRTAMVDKQHHRMQSAIQEIVAHLVNFATRRRYAKVLYSDQERWLEEFPYFTLEGRIKVKLDEAGIVFEKAASGEVTAESQEPLAEE
jgi:hypothetical protein